MVQIRGATKYFGKLAAVDHLDLDFTPGVTGLVGHNGAGKSTLFRLIAGIFTLDEGTIDIGGYSNYSVEGKSKLFFLNDDPMGSGNWMDIYNFYAVFYSIDLDRYQTLLKKFGLPTDKPVRTFSKGMRRQLFLCLAMSVEADVYLLDEAFDGIDPLIQDMIKEELKILASQGKTIVISGHNLLSLEKLADRFVILYKGKLAKEGGNQDLGKTMVKFQCLPSSPLTPRMLSDLGFDVISFKQVGSIVNFVVTEKPDGETILNNALKPKLLEIVPLDQDEVITLQMRLAKDKGEGHE